VVAQLLCDALLPAVINVGEGAAQFDRQWGAWLNSPGNAFARMTNGMANPFRIDLSLKAGIRSLPDSARQKGNDVRQLLVKVGKVVVAAGHNLELDMVS
jgi:hypothetical protein